MNYAKFNLEHGASYPYDASDKWRDGDGENPPPAKDWAHAAARGIMVDLTDRSGIKHGFVGIDEQTRVEIVEKLAEVIRLAAACFAAGAEQSANDIATLEQENRQMRARMDRYEKALRRIAMNVYGDTVPQVIAGEAIDAAMAKGE